MTPSAKEIIEQLKLTEHPEGGWYRETWREESNDKSRGLGSMILYLLAKGQKSHWHRIDATEIWIHQGGGKLDLHKWNGDGPVVTQTLGSDYANGNVPQAVIQPHEWQAAETESEYVLIACTVIPGFTFDTFEMAPAGWAPNA